MTHLSINEDGTLPMDIDAETGRRTPTAAVEAHFSAAGGEHPDLAAHEALGLADAGHSHASGDHPNLLTHTGMGLAATSHDHPHAHSYASNTHAHAQADITSLTTDLAAKASSTHNHDATYSVSAHTHSYAATSHTHLDADLPAGLARDSEVTSAISDHLTNATHGGGPGGEAFPVGSVFIGVVATNPATLLGYGTWAAFGAGRVLIGNDGATYDTDEATGGAATAAISAHANSAVAQHAAQSHSAHAGATVANHTDVTNHVHVQSVNSATTGGLSGYTPDTSSNTSTASGYSTANPTSVGVAAMVHTVGQANNHSDHAALTHSVTQADAHTDVSTVQPYIVVHMWKRTA